MLTWLRNRVQVGLKWQRDCAVQLRRFAGRCLSHSKFDLRSQWQFVRTTNQGLPACFQGIGN